MAKKTPQQLLEEAKNQQLGGTIQNFQVSPQQVQNESKQIAINEQNKPLKLDVSQPTNNINQPMQNVNAPLKQPEFTNTVGNNSAGTLVLPNGKTFVGISNKDAQNFTNNFMQEQNPVQGAVPIGTAQAEANRQQRLQQLMQLGQQGVLTQQELQAIQEAPIDWGQALTAGSLGNLPSVLTNVGVGAAAGAAVGAPVGGVGAIPGAIVGGVGGLVKSIWTGTTANIKRQQSGNIQATKDVLTAARTNMRALVMVASKDPSKSEEAIQQYYAQLAQVQRAQRKLQMETSGNLNKFMEDGTQDLSDFELFLQPGGYADIQLMRLQNAVSSGQPVSDEELLQLAQEYSNE